MAKYESRVHGDFNSLLNSIDSEILRGSMSASFEDGSDYHSGDFRCAVRVYERYSMIGGNRVSMNVTLVGNNDELFITAITSGGSQAVLFKINTLGEEAFLNCIVNVIDRFKG
ncbi:MAG: hypothetical protein JXQ23_10025 [Clostridia bacterium]|nr:hypothetical protein [Clostridia bacterium]